MIVLDTNVISETFKSRPEPRVVAWLESLSDDVAITAITLAELLAGIRQLPAGHRRSTVLAAVNAAVAPYRSTKAVLAFDEGAAEPYAEILALRRHAGLPISTADAQIAAICRVHSATCATRNIKDFARTGIELVDPWGR